MPLALHALQLFEDLDYKLKARRISTSGSEFLMPNSGVELSKTNIPIVTLYIFTVSDRFANRTSYLKFRKEKSGEDR